MTRKPIVVVNAKVKKVYSQMGEQESLFCFQIRGGQ